MTDDNQSVTDEKKESQPVVEKAVPKTEFDKVLSESIERKNELKELKKQIEQLTKAKEDSEAKALVEQGNFKALYEQEVQKNADLNKQLNDVSNKVTEYEPFVNEYKQQQESRKRELLSKVPETERSKWESSDMALLESFVNTITKVPANSLNQVNGTQPKVDTQTTQKDAPKVPFGSGMQKYTDMLTNKGR